LTWSLSISLAVLPLYCHANAKATVNYSNIVFEEGSVEGIAPTQRIGKM
jgi:hypothetical protein